MRHQRWTRVMHLNFLKAHIVLFLMYPLNTFARKKHLFDMTGEMPNVEKLGLGYRSKLCTTSPAKMLDEEQSSGHNIWQCLRNTSLKCPSTKTEVILEKYFVSNRRELLKRVPLTQRKRRGQGWLNGHPNRQDYELIDRQVLSSRKGCFIISKECIQSGLSSPELLEYESSFPLFEIRSWGSCAFVGLSDDLLLHEYGKEIDAHDTVIRLGHIPLIKYKKYVGSRSDIVVFRPSALNRDQKKHRPSDVKAYLCKNPSRVLNTETAVPVSRKTSFVTVKNSSNIYCDKKRGKNDFAYLLLGQLYKNMAPNKKPTTGTLYAIRIALSRLCGRLDIYGISSGGGGTYFEPEAITKTKHGTELDSWLLHHFMKNYQEDLRMCIYS